MCLRPQVNCYSAKLKNPWNISFKNKWVLFSGPCWTCLINWLPQFPNQLKIPLLLRDIKINQILNQVRPQLQNPAHPDLRISQFQARNLWTQPIPRWTQNCLPHLGISHSDISSDPDIEPIRVEKVQGSHIL